MSLEKMQTPHGKTSHETRFSNYEPVVPSVSMLSPPQKALASGWTPPLQTHRECYQICKETY